MSTDGNKRKVCAAVLLICASCAARRDPLPEFPRVVLWAWERPEHLSYIDPVKVGVAYLAATIGWQAGELKVRPRYQPLDIPPGAAVMAVVRLESASGPLPDPDVVAERVVALVPASRAKALQTDFDARLSERDWYAQVLRDVRRRLPAHVSLNITALASWCLGDPWIRNLPINDAVPMLFRMGAGEPRKLSDFSSEVCRSSVGISTDEAAIAPPHGRRIFIFHPRPWTPEAYRAAMEIARRMR